MFPTKHGIVAVSSSELINNASVSNGCIGLWCLKPLSTISQLYSGRQFY